MPEILRAAERRASPWKNGGGVTFEVLSHPPGSTLDSFDWRISLAEMREAGPFSVFPGIDRQLLILEGRLALEVEGRETRELSERSAVTEFPGDVKTYARPLTPTVTDFNVMTRRGKYTARITRLHGERAPAVRAPIAFSVLFAIGAATARVGQERYSLAPRDALLLDSGAEDLELHPHADHDGEIDCLLIELSRAG